MNAKFMVPTSGQTVMAVKYVGGNFALTSSNVSAQLNVSSHVMLNRKVKSAAGVYVNVSMSA